ncbi:hypothetical protein WJX74_008851 [Apatococcus lobatus]|uniref:Glutamine amidotransferase type-2 domain-containing protein n=1 Tax=Apatococcus lobatus TaxID=904363 RepID=A0AAW1RJM0_9CHLO
MVQAAFLCACAPKELELGGSGQLRKSTRDVEGLTRSSFGEASRVLTSPGGCISAAGQPSVISAGKTGALLTAVVGTISNYGYLVNKYLLAELRPEKQAANGFTLNDVSKQEPVSVATLIAYLFSTLGPAGLLRKLRGLFALVVYDPSKAWVLAARSPGAKATVIQALGPDGSLLIASEPSRLPPGSHSLQELQPGCFKLGWHSGPRCYVRPAATSTPQSAATSGKPASNLQVKAAAAALTPGPQDTGAVKRTRRGKRGGRKHAAEAEQKSQERQKKLPGRHSLDALLHTATQSGVQLSNLRHMVISEDLPTPKAPAAPADGPSWRKPETPLRSTPKPAARASSAQTPPRWSTMREPAAALHVTSSANHIASAAAPAPSAPIDPSTAIAFGNVGIPMSVDEHEVHLESSHVATAAATGTAAMHPGSPLAAAPAADANLQHLSVRGPARPPLQESRAADKAKAEVPTAAAQPCSPASAGNENEEPGRHATFQDPKRISLGPDTAQDSSARSLPTTDASPTPAAAEAQAHTALQRMPSHASAPPPSALPAARSRSGDDCRVPAASALPAARSSSGDGLKVQLPPIRTLSPSNSSPNTSGPLKVAKSPRSSFDSPRSRPLDDLDDIENSPPPAGASPTRREMSQLTAGLLKRISGRSLKKSDSNMSLASTSSQGSAGQSPSSSRRSPLGLLRHLAHATIRRGFASHSTPNLAAMAAESAGCEELSSQEMGVPEWARQPHFEPHMASVTEDAEEGLTTPMGSLQNRNIFGTPRSELFSRRALQSRSGVDAASSETTPLSHSLEPLSFGSPSLAVGRGEDTGHSDSQASGSMQRQLSHGDGEDAWDTLWSATPWDAALVGMASLRAGGGQQAIAATHPVGMGGRPASAAAPCTSSHATTSDEADEQVKELQ